MTFFLDTDVCVYCLTGRNLRLRDRVGAQRPRSIRIPAIVKAELLAGARKGNRPAKTIEEILAFLRPFEIVAFDDQASDYYGQIRAELERIGKPIGPYDMLIAATVLAQDGILVTHNTREFRRVKHLRWEDWTK